MRVEEERAARAMPVLEANDKTQSNIDVLLSLPCLTHNDLRSFEETVAKTPSPKEQKQLMRSLLLLGTGNNLRALAAQKNMNVITNVTLRTRGPADTSEAKEMKGKQSGWPVCCEMKPL
ncbi:hypothetical protein Bca52824_055242 [Brassica carinata]|uniref:Exportin-5 C-terminal domain-containing protein n=1 Tax=Brassica carinata TaxID=52824 RepID=A0A8X7RAB7_BRACI|nr:hypothetical protein Bca52824_055242 [Brassica carinata]